MSKQQSLIHAMGAFLVLAGAACSSLSSTPSGSLAAVKIGGGHTAEAVAEATVAVFQEAGYHTDSTGDQLVFQRPGNRLEQISYGDNLGEGQVLNRVVTRLVDLGGGAYRLECDAYIIRQAGTRLENEIRLRPPRSRPYRALLDQVVQRLAETKP